MKKYIFLMLSVVLTAMLGACSKDDPFDNYNQSATGGLRSSALEVSVVSDDNSPAALKGLEDTRSGLVDQCNVAIYKKDATEPYATYKYSNMPEIITLPVGEYFVKAYYGENEAAAWNAPYYAGESDIFTIEENKITESVQPIRCTLRNVRVSIVIDPSLQEAITGDYEVKVVVNDVGTLIFTKDRIEANESGYFKYVEGSSTLAATFSGEVDGVMATETRTNVTVAPGHHYTITFKLYSADVDEPGAIKPDGESLIKINAMVKDGDKIIGNVETDDEIIKDDSRPSEGEQPGTEEPTPDDPVGNALTMEAEAPIVLDQAYIYPTDGNGPAVVINVHSDAGIETFTVNVKMANVQDSELIDMHLQPEMDLVNPDDYYKDNLATLGFPVNVGGKNDVRIEISKDLMGMLAILEGVHEFRLNVGDKNGKLSKSLLIKIVK